MKKWTIFFITLLFATMVYASDDKPRIGVAWIEKSTETYDAVCQVIRKAGGTPVVLDQVLSPDLEYDKNGLLVNASDFHGALSAEAAKPIRCNTWQGSNVEKVMDGISAVIFPGGKDISPSLYYEPQSSEDREPYCAERDVSDYLLISYCLEHDVPILCICRGMQLLSIVSGAQMIKDIKTEMETKRIDYDFSHRNEPEEPDAYRDFAFHDVTVTDHASLLYRLTGSAILRNVPSWHHQAVRSVDGTRLKITASTETQGEEIIEAVERPDKSFALGLQFHPVIAVVRGPDEDSIVYFTAFVNAAKENTYLNAA